MIIEMFRRMSAGEVISKRSVWLGKHLLHSRQHVIEQEDFGRRIDCSCKTDARFLASRKDRPLLPYFGLIPQIEHFQIRQQRAGLQDLFIAFRVEGRAEYNVVSDRVIQKPWRLGTVGDCVCEDGRILACPADYWGLEEATATEEIHLAQQCL